MRILVDGDACPVKKEIKKISLKYFIDVIYYTSVSHYTFDKLFHNTVYLDNQSQEVDIRIINDITKEDLLITDDYGLACATLQKCKAVLSSSGTMYTKDNIELLLYQRHLAQIARKKREKVSNKKKRNEEINEHFYEMLKTVVEKAIDNK